MNPLKKNALLVAAISALAASANAQQTLTFTGTFVAEDEVGSSLNATATATATTGFRLSRSVTWTGGTASAPTARALNTAGMALKNSAFPNLWLTVSASASTLTATSTALTGTRVAAGLLGDVVIPAGSTWTAEFYDFADQSTLPPAVTFTNPSFSLAVAPTPVLPTFAHTLSAAGPIDASATAGDPGNTIVNAGSAAQRFIYPDNTTLASGAVGILLPGTRYEQVATGNYVSDLVVRIRHTAYPNLVNDLRLPQAGTFPVGQFAEVASPQGLTGTRFDIPALSQVNLLYRALIPTAGNFAVEIYDLFDDNVGGVDARITNLAIGLPSGLINPDVRETFIATSVPSVDLLDDPDNATVTLGNATGTYTYSPEHPILNSAVFTANAFGTAMGETRVRMFNSARPYWWADYIMVSGGTANPLTNGALSPGDQQTLPGSFRMIRTGVAPLGFSQIPAGSTYTAQFYESVDNSAGIADGTWDSLSISPVAAATPLSNLVPSANVTNLGVLHRNATTVTLPAVPAGQTAWVRFEIPEVNGFAPAARFFDAWSALGTGNNTDTDLFLHRNDGVMVNFNSDESATNLFSRISLGRAAAPRSTPGFVNAASGQQGFGLEPGVYWLGVARDGNSATTTTTSNTLIYTFASAGATALAVTAGTTIELRTNVFQELSGQIQLNDVTASPTFSRTITWTVKDSGGNVLRTGDVAVPGLANLVASAPWNVAGAATVEFDGSSFLRKVINLTLTGSAQNLGTVALTNGDVNADGIVDGNDVNAILADFGNEGDGLTADVNMDGIIDGNDINVVLGTFGSEDE